MGAHWTGKIVCCLSIGNKMCKGGVLRMIRDQAQKQKNSQGETNCTFNFPYSLVISLFFFHCLLFSQINETTDAKKFG